MLGCDEERRSVKLGHFDLDLSVRVAVQCIGKAKGFDNISSANLVVVFLVSKPEGQDTLFLSKG